MSHLTKCGLIYEFSTETKFSILWNNQQTDWKSIAGGEYLYILQRFPIHIVSCSHERGGSPWCFTSRLLPVQKYELNVCHGINAKRNTDFTLSLKSRSIHKRSDLQGPFDNSKHYSNKFSKWNGTGKSTAQYTRLFKATGICTLLYACTSMHIDCAYTSW